MRQVVLSGMVVLSVLGSIRADDQLVPVGAAKVDVTPAHPVVLAGYGGRSTELEGIDTRLWARAMWKYAFHAVLRGKSKEGTGPAVGAVGVPERRERGRHSEGAEAGAPHRRGRSRTRRGSGSPPLTEENVGRLTKRKIKEQKRNMIQMLDRFIHSLPLEE